MTTAKITTVIIILAALRLRAVTGGVAPSSRRETIRVGSRTTSSSGSRLLLPSPVIELKGDNVIITNVRSEDEFIIEWLNYHLWVGFDTVLIFCQDDDPDALRQLLDPYIRSEAVVLHPWPVGKQLESFWYYLDNYQRDGQTILFSDIDEFLVLCQHATVGEFLAELSPHTKCMTFPYYSFGTSFLPKHPDGGSVMSHYFLRDSEQTQLLSKVAVRSPLHRTKFNKHSQNILDNGIVHHRCALYDLPTKDSKQEHISQSLARLHHYKYRGGLQGFNRRINRGGDAVHGRGKRFERRAHRLEKTDIRKRSKHINVLSDPTLLSIEREFPYLMVPQPPGSRRATVPEGGFCKEPARDPFPPSKYSRKHSSADREILQEAIVNMTHILDVLKKYASL